METILFKEVAAQWIETKRKLVKHSTFCAYNLTLHTHLLPLFGNNAIITEAKAQKMVIDKLNAGLARKTVRDILATLKTIVKYGVKHCGWSSISWDIEFPTETTAKELPVLTLANQRKLMKHISQSTTAQNIGV